MKSLFIVVPVLLLTACSNHNYSRKNYVQATVTSAVPVYKTVEIRKPKEVCEERHVVKREADSAAPTIVGAIIGGALGNAVARGRSNKNVGMVAGAVIGGAIGNDVGKQNGSEVVHLETVCYRAGDEISYESVIDGYQVTYQLNGREYTVVMDRDPGPQMPVYVDPSINR